MAILKKSATERQELPRIKVPTLISWGDRDEFFPVKCGEEWKKMIPGSRLIVDHGNHDWCLFKPEAAAKMIEKFIG
jgi:pimeloyl-ACP methyl ester carboxylesterase